MTPYTDHFGIYKLSIAPVENTNENLLEVWTIFSNHELRRFLFLFYYNSEWVGGLSDFGDLWRRRDIALPQNRDLVEIALRVKF